MCPAVYPFEAVSNSRDTSNEPRRPVRGGVCGLTAHRGVLHPDDYVDEGTLVTLVEDELGFTSSSSIP